MRPDKSLRRYLRTYPVRVTLLFILSVHFLSMVVWPLYDRNLDFNYLMAVWSRWQTYNASLFAIYASIGAFSIQHYLDDQKRKRNFIASRAFLPDALHKASKYCRHVSDILKDIWNSEASDTPYDTEFLSKDSLTIETEAKEVFEKCIREAPIDVGNWMATLMAQIQILDARLEMLKQNLSSPRDLIISKSDVISAFCRLLALKARIDRLYDFARGLGGLNTTELNHDEFYNASHNLNIVIDNIKDTSDGVVISSLNRKIDQFIEHPTL